MHNSPEEIVAGHEYLVEEYSYFLDIGLVYPQINTKIWHFFYNIRFACLVSFVLYVGGWFLRTAVIALSDLSISGIALHVIIIGFVGTGIVLLSYKNRSIFWEYLIYFNIQKAQNVAYANNDLDRKLKMERQILKKKICIMWPAYYGIVFAVLIVLSPIIDNCMGMSSPPNESGNGIAMTLPLPSWTPFDADHSWTAFFLTFLFQLAYFAGLAIPWSAGMMFFLENSLLILDHMKLLINSLQEIDNRAKHLYEVRYPGRKFDENSKEYDDCYYACLRDSIIHYIYLKKSFKMYGQIISFSLFILFAVGAFSMALAGAHVMSDGPKMTKKVCEIFLVIGEVVLMGMYCVFGETFKSKCEEIRDEIYGTQWYNRSAKVRRAISIFMHMTLNPMVLVAGNLIAINLLTFSMTMNSAYSYLNLFYATQY
ncbi:Odorant receptor [Nesidiocoris tenuis]|uniref:Odorant receptor n=1 Tax=Nesidiocoris tenuis TaxID=355587 RepID=A0ABN7AER1_9HEMI|nr:Odorant receptor [Nesidiocoris tenuis]